MSESEQNVVVLVADDEPSTLALVASHVRGKGYKVLEASDGDQAWQLAHEHLPDSVILDVMMPGMSGWEVCRKIREAVSLAHTGVIMLTGIGENLNEMTSPLYGADAYLDKPFEFTELDAKVTATLAERKDGAMGRPEPEETRKSSHPPALANGKSTLVAAQAPLAKTRAKKEKERAPKKAATSPKGKTVAKALPKKPTTPVVEMKTKAKPAKAKAAPKKGPAAKAPVAKAAPKKAAKATKAAPKKAAKVAPKSMKMAAPKASKGKPAVIAKKTVAPKKAVAKAKPVKAKAKAMPVKAAPAKAAPPKAGPAKAAPAKASKPSKKARKPGRPDDATA